MFTRHQSLILAFVLGALIAGCGNGAPADGPPLHTDAVALTPIPHDGQAVTPASATTVTATPGPSLTPTAGSRPDNLSPEQAATLSSLAKVDEYPLYTMNYEGDYDQGIAWLPDGVPERPDAAWACSLFAALGDEQQRLYGRNFDWQFSPALLLFTAPPGAYASVSMVDIAYLGFEGAGSGNLLELPLVERRSLLEAPHWPFDGMNEHGLAVGMAAVPPGGVAPDPAKPTLDSLGVIRTILDHARDVNEAVSILQSHNVDFGGGPPLHYLLSDRAGRSVLVEYYQGEMAVIPNEQPWHMATNFLRTAAGESAEGQCSRFDRIEEVLSRAGGRLSPSEALDLLAQVGQGNTQWSVVYGMSSGDILISMGRQYEDAYRFNLPLDSWR